MGKKNFLNENNVFLLFDGLFVFNCMELCQHRIYLSRFINSGGLPSLGDIELVHKKKAHDRESRLATVAVSLVRLSSGFYLSPKHKPSVIIFWVTWFSNKRCWGIYSWRLHGKKGTCPLSKSMTCAFFPVKSSVDLIHHLNLQIFTARLS